ncbi:hypothetical protein CONPUDRAFT_83897 [Coniophora puteana RWD-64-598 SS2]|uniref:Uncharacterized protein n=1 Tax=Coniophora puteana (strain RWD-64-598) TaxID=741705 RepID=A0A5M3MH19_CONPW|nr:uncharacterized protein CONPUDRAFT_83897 [Coniophora puteana RWD-64-598 SS2]EIW78528.1 hypothetical protein CONPUDRAFT_83897 [Coniophora puteana RWD-64-598 SS2]
MNGLLFESYWQGKIHRTIGVSDETLLALRVVASRLWFLHTRSSKSVIPHLLPPAVVVDLFRIQEACTGS